MHTSSRLTSADFTYQKSEGQKQATPQTFADFCADYHAQDRVGVVSPDLHDGVLCVGQSLLALTTAFYDYHRESGSNFFDYPQHFAFVGSDSVADPSKGWVPWTAWSKLDVWPDNKWITVAPTATSMLHALFDFQINRLFWPQNFWPAPDEDPLPDYAYRMLQTRLKSIYLYSQPDRVEHANSVSSNSVIEVSGSAAVKTLLQESIEHLPNPPQPEAIERLQPISVSDFMAKVQGSSETE